MKNDVTFLVGDRFIWINYICWIKKGGSELLWSVYDSCVYDISTDSIFNVLSNLCLLTFFCHSGKYFLILLSYKCILRYVLTNRHRYLYRDGLLVVFVLKTESSVPKLLGHNSDFQIFFQIMEINFSAVDNDLIRKTIVCSKNFTGTLDIWIFGLKFVARCAVGKSININYMNKKVVI